MTRWSGGLLKKFLFLLQSAIASYGRVSGLLFVQWSRDEETYRTIENMKEEGEQGR